MHRVARPYQTQHGIRFAEIFCDYVDAREAQHRQHRQRYALDNGGVGGVGMLRGLDARFNDIVDAGIDDDLNYDSFLAHSDFHIVIR